MFKKIPGNPNYKINLDEVITNSEGEIVFADENLDKLVQDCSKVADATTSTNLMVCFEFIILFLFFCLLYKVFGGPFLNKFFKTTLPALRN